MAPPEADGRAATPPLPDPATFLDDPRFHRTFALPAGPDRPHPLQVTYSDYGYRDPEDPDRERVLLLCGPLMGSRLLHVAKDALAKRHRVRVVHPDRPGFGGTTPVPAADRVRVWLETVPALLAHLGVRRVSVAAHSGGTVYALNTLLSLRHLLGGGGEAAAGRPYVALVAPWIHPSRSGVALMRAAAALPDAVLGRFDALAGVFQGVDRVFSESVQGLGQEAILLLKRDGHPGYWGPWGDHDGLVALLAEAEAELGAAAGGGGGSGGGQRLKVDVYFAEADHMIGAGEGPRWFEDCWRAERRGGLIDFSSRVVPGTDHDGIMDLRFGVFESILRQVARFLGTSSFWCRGGPGLRVLGVRFWCLSAGGP
ncbi:hypothetical protein LX36DRAFT_14506 [Colletotrichum falcatum]|nr:hypothetical protein LX36DRAFT_14506 [Colletotrichum falcatum]